MISLTYGMQNMAQINIYKTETDSQSREQTYGCQRGKEKGVEGTRSLRLVDANHYIQNG